MLRHKFMNERTVAFDDKVYNDLELLADVTGRTREELIHTAAIDLIKENKVYPCRLFGGLLGRQCGAGELQGCRR